MWDLRTGAGTGDDNEGENNDYIREVLEAMVDNTCTRTDQVLTLEGGRRLSADLED